MENFTQRIPKEQMAIVKDALTCYRETLKVADRSRQDVTLGHTIFDIHSLIGLLDREVVVELTKDEVDSFGKYGVDYPEYTSGYELTQTPPTDFDWFKRNAIFNVMLKTIKGVGKGGSHTSVMLDEYAKAYGENCDVILAGIFTDEVIELSKFQDGDQSQDDLGNVEYAMNRLHPDGK